MWPSRIPTVDAGCVFIFVFLTAFIRALQPYRTVPAAVSLFHHTGENIRCRRRGRENQPQPMPPSSLTGHCAVRRVESWVKLVPYFLLFFIGDKPRVRFDLLQGFNMRSIYFCAAVRSA